MKRRNSKLIGRTSVGCLIIIVSIMIFSISCKKDSENKTYHNDIGEVAKVLDGELFNGNVSIESNNIEMCLNYNNSDKVILVDKLTNTEYPNIPNMKSAEIMVSDYGIILKDAVSDQTFLLINNDPKSIEKFRSIQSLFTGHVQHRIIYGTTVINSERI